MPTNFYKPVSCDGRINPEYQPKYRAKISIYLRTETEDKHVSDFYNCDLDELVKRHHSQAFQYGERYKLVSSCGYVEYIR